MDPEGILEDLREIFRPALLMPEQLFMRDIAVVRRQQTRDQRDQHE